MLCRSQEYSRLHDGRIHSHPSLRDYSLPLTAPSHGSHTWLLACPTHSCRQSNRPTPYYKTHNTLRRLGSRATKPHTGQGSLSSVWTWLQSCGAATLDKEIRKQETKHIQRRHSVSIQPHDLHARSQKPFMLCLHSVCWETTPTPNRPSWP